MALRIDASKSHFVSFTAIFSAFIAVLDVIPMVPGFYGGIWDSWVFVLSPLVGILLGPFAGAFSVLLGSLLGHMIFFRDPYELVFMMGAPFGAMMSGLVYQGRWKPVLGLYSTLLLGYFLTPISWVLPLWGVWDLMLGYGVVLLFVFLTTHTSIFNKDSNRTGARLLFCSVIGLESDILLRIFILIPGQTYWIFYGLTPEMLQLMWAFAGFITPLKVLVASIVVVILGLTLLRLDLPIFASETAALDPT
ncbi:MAG: hypothetical protein ACTSUB_09145 [Candidatus Thorarchaeota archaeon]